MDVNVSDGIAVLVRVKVYVMVRLGVNVLLKVGLGVFVLVAEEVYVLVGVNVGEKHFMGRETGIAALLFEPLFQ